MFTKIVKLWLYWPSHRTPKAEIKVCSIKDICPECNVDHSSKTSEQAIHHLWWVVWGSYPLLAKVSINIHRMYWQQMKVIQIIRSNTICYMLWTYILYTAHFYFCFWCAVRRSVQTQFNYFGKHRLKCMATPGLKATLECQFLLLVLV